MPKSNSERQADHRRRQSRYVTATFSKVLKLEDDFAELRNSYVTEQNAKILKLEQELETLRNEVANLTQKSLRSPIKKILTSSESKSPKVDRERAEARLDRLRAWNPSKEEEEKAFTKGLDQTYVSRQAELYRCRQENATGNARHTNFDAGFRAWMIRAPTFDREVQQPKPNGSASAAYGPLRDPTEIWAEIQAREQERGPNASGD